MKKSWNAYTQIKWGAVLSYLSIGCNILLGLLYTPWMVETIGKSQYGLYTLANSTITLFLVDFGLGSATTRYLSKYNAEGDTEGAERFLGAVYKLYLMIDAVILILLTLVFLGMDRIFVNLTPEELTQFRVVYAITALFSVVNFPFITFNGILTAYEKFIPLKITDILYRLFTVGFTVIALLMGYGLYALVSVHAVVGLLTLVIKSAVIYRTIPIKVDFRRTSGNIYREIAGFSFWMMITSLVARLVIGIMPSILGIVANSGEIAVFGIMITIEGYAYTITTAIASFFMTRVSAAMLQKDSEKYTNQLFLTVGKFQYAILGLIIAGFAVNGWNFIKLWMGQEYTQAYAGILLMIIPGLFAYPMQIADTMMIVMKKVKQIALITAATSLVNVCLALPMAKRFGALGACISICVAYLVRDILLNITYHRELPLDIPRFIKECYVKMSVPIWMTVVCGGMMNRCIPDGGWGVFLLKAAMTVLIYLVTLVCFGLSGRERHSLLNRLKRK